MQFSLPTLLALLPFFLTSISAQSAGVTTRYWDCCKASCGWPLKLTTASGSNPVTSCDKNDNPIYDYNTVSVCNGGTAAMCSSQSPWAVSSTLSYGFAATHIAGGTEASWCCACYALTFTSGPVAGKTMIVQSTNTGGDLGNNHFDIAMPGGGFGIYDGCTSEWGTPSTGWGAQYGGVTTRSQCDAFPARLQAGCYWRFDWFMNADNPTVSFTQVACPAALTAKSGCVRANDNINEAPTGPVVVPTWTSGAAVSSSTSSSTKSSTTSTTTSTTSSSKASTSSSSSSSSKPVTTSTSTTSSKVSSTSTTTSSAPSSTNTLPPVPRWGQCGGQQYLGSPVCVSPWVCTYNNPFYSQCL